MSALEKKYNWVDFKDFITKVKTGDEIKIWSDGGCNPNPGPGGWGVILRKGNVNSMLTGGGLNTTNNRMEMIAALSGMDCLPNNCNVTLYSDSQYVIKGLSQWMYGWRKKKWVKKDGGEIPNVDLWKELYNISRRHSLKCLWVKGHNGHSENEMCDYLATQSRIKLEEMNRKEKYINSRLPSKNKKG